jgi:hypothetical protein
MQNKHNILDFKTFESKVEYLSIEDINEIFIEVLDLGYVAKFYGGGISNNTSVGTFAQLLADRDGRSGAKFGIYYFDLKKESKSSFGWIDNSYAWGCTDLLAMSKEMNDLLLILDDIKERLNSMGYTVGFEPEFSFSENSMFSIVCHMQHSSHDED